MKKMWLLMCLMVLLLLPVTAMAVCGHNNLTEPGVAGTRDKYVPYSSTQHERQTALKFVCLTCGDSFWMDWSCEWFPHEFSGNKCTVCGYTKGGSGGGSSTSCNHNDVSYHVSTLFGSLGYKSNTSTTHYVERHYRITCKVCGKVIDSDYVGRTTESHSFNSAGKCAKCGYSRVVSPPVDIPSGAGEFGGHYYFIYELDYITSWKMAKEFCEARGGHLVVITSRAENDYVYSYLSGKGYVCGFIGLSDAEKEGQWKWCNGEPVTYTNWHAGEPNNERSAEDYAMFYLKFTDGTWNDGEFGRRQEKHDNVFICEWD